MYRRARRGNLGKGSVGCAWVAVDR